MLACMRRQGRHLAGALRKIMGAGGIHRQAHLAVMIEGDGIPLLKTEWIDGRPAVDAANAAFARPFDAAGRPRRPTPRTLLIHEGVIAKGSAVRQHRAGGGRQREDGHGFDGDGQSITDSRSLYGHRARDLVSPTKLRRNHRPPAAGRHDTADAPPVPDRRRETQARTNQPAGILVYKDLFLDIAVHCTHENTLLSLHIRDTFDSFPGDVCSDAGAHHAKHFSSGRRRQRRYF